MLESTWNHKASQSDVGFRWRSVRDSLKKKKQQPRWLTGTQKNPDCFLSCHLCELIKPQLTVYDKRIERERDFIPPGTEKCAGNGLECLTTGW